MQEWRNTTLDVNRKGDFPFLKFIVTLSGKALIPSSLTGSTEQERSRGSQDKAISRKYSSPYEQRGKEQKGANHSTKKVLS